MSKINKNILDQLSNWKQVHLLKTEVLDNKDLLNEIAIIALKSREHDSWRAAWILDKVGEENPLLTKPYLQSIINWIEFEESNSKLRHFLRIISNHPIDEKNYSQLFNTCLTIFENNKAPIASRSFALKILYSIVKDKKTLQDELKELIYFELEKSSSPGIKSRCKNILKKLQ